MAAQPQWKFIKGYDYRDEQGVLKYQVIRWEPKRFQQRRPNPNYDPKLPESKESNPKWFNNMDGVTRILYKLPELKAALLEKSDRVIFVLEGEKDVDLARENDIQATCNPGGALKFYAEYAHHFKGANVFVFADNDPVDSTQGFSPGLRHAEEVCALLKPVAASVKMATFPGAPKKGDFTEYWVRMLTAGKEPAAIRRELFELYKATPVWEPKQQEPERKPEPEVKPGASGIAEEEKTKKEAETQKVDSKPAEEKPKPPEPSEKDMKAKIDAKDKEQAPPPQAVGEVKPVQSRVPVKFDDAMATVGERVAELKKLKPSHSAAEISGSLGIQLLAFNMELTRLPGQIDGDVINDALVTIAAMCVEYLTGE